MVARVRHPLLRLLAALAVTFTVSSALLAAPAGGAPPEQRGLEPVTVPGDPGTEKISSRGKEEDSCKGGKRKLPLMPDIPSVECMTKKAVRTIFGMPKDGWVVKPLLKWLLKVPDFVETPARGVGDAEWLSESIGFALLLGVVTFAMLHYFAVGFTSQGSGSLLIDGVVRCVGAGMLILAWPFLYQSVAEITNAVTSALLPNSAIEGSIAAIVAAGGALTGGWGTLIIWILVEIVFILLFFALLLVKIGLMAGLLAAFVGMPIALALWPVPSLSPPVAYAFRFVGMFFSLLIVWALLFKTFGAVNTQFVGNKPNLNLPDRMLLPAIGIGELGALVAAPRHVMAMWNIAPRRGTVGSILSFAASNMISSKLSQLGKTAVGKVKSGGQGASSPFNRFGGGRGGPGPGGPGPGGGRQGQGIPGGGGPDGQTPGGGPLPPPGHAPHGSPNGNGNGSAGNGNGRPATTGGDGLPRAREDDPRGKQQAEAMRRAAMERRRGQPPGPATVRAAYRQIAAADGGRYARPLLTTLSDGRGDDAVTRRMSWAAATPGLSGGLSAAFQRVAAATPQTRREALDALEPTATPPPPPPPP